MKVTATERLGLPFIHAYLDAIRADFSHGVNFATAGSTIRAPNGDEGYSPFYLGAQWSQFTQFKSRSQLDYNQEGVFKDLLPKEDYFSRALYTFDIGQNDLTISDFFNMTTQQVTDNITAIMNNFVTVVKDVYNSGGRFFWIHNTGPIGCLAYVLDSVPENQTDVAGCAIEWNKLAQYFNRRLNETVVQLRKDLPLGVFTYVDVYSVKYALFSQPKKYGFEEPLIVCCGRGGKYNYSRLSRCGTTVVVDGTETVVGACEDPSVRVNWDGVHYTDAANKWVFDQIATGAFSHPPLPLKMACSTSNKPN
ncbi:hypothetical protein ACLOJK_003776 [Asimina triloba]